MNRSRKSFLDDLLGDGDNGGSPPKPRPSTAGPATGSASMASPSSSVVGAGGGSRQKSVRFSESGRDHEVFTSFGQSSSSSLGQQRPSAPSSSLDQLFGNGGHGDEDDILGSISFTRGSRTSSASASGGRVDPGLNTSSELQSRKTMAQPTSSSRPSTAGAGGKGDWLGLLNDDDADTDFNVRKSTSSTGTPSWLSGAVSNMAKSTFPDVDRKQENVSSVPSGTSSTTQSVSGSSNYEQIHLQRSDLGSSFMDPASKTAAGSREANSGLSATSSSSPSGRGMKLDQRDVDPVSPGSMIQGKESIGGSNFLVPSLHGMKGGEDSPTSVGLQPRMSLPSSSFTTDSSLLLLQTQVKVLEMEKENLKQSLEKCKRNHEEEIKMMKDIHEKQLEMTRNVITQQESLVGSDSERRINDLKSRIDSIENEREEERRKMKQRMDDLYKEWKEEVAMIQNSHRSHVSRLVAEHEEDMERMKKRKEREVDTMVKLNGQEESLTSLLDKWNSTADQMEQLQSKVIREQEGLISEKLVTITDKAIKLDGLDNNWNSLRTELLEEKERMKSVQTKFLDLMAEEKSVLSSELKRLADERYSLSEDKRLFEKEMKRREDELMSQHDSLAVERNQQLKENETLMRERNEINSRLKMLELKEEETRIKIEAEHKKLQEKEFSIRDAENRNLIESNSIINEKKMIEFERDRLDQMKNIQDKEKSKLDQLASDIKGRASQLETRYEHISKEKEETIEGRNNISKLKKQVEKQYIQMEERMKVVNEKESRLNVEYSRINSEWNELRSAKESILCSLCNMSINRGYIHMASVGGALDTSASSLIPISSNGSAGDGFKLHHQISNSGTFLVPGHFNHHYYSGNEQDPLLLWQINSQRDMAQLAEETAFVQRLKRAAIRGKEEDDDNG